MVTEQNITYEAYLKEHITNVNRAYQWLKKRHVIDAVELMSMNENDQIMCHDITKWEEEEYDAYSDYFYGKEGKDEDDIAVIDGAFDYAWLHHIHRNPHHWQYWVLNEDEGRVKALEMPKNYVYEMISDWWSFSWQKGDLKEIFSWYDGHKAKMQLHPKTKELVEEILGKIKDILEKEEKEAKEKETDESRNELPV